MNIEQIYKDKHSNGEKSNLREQELEESVPILSLSPLKNFSTGAYKCRNCSYSQKRNFQCDTNIPRVHVGGFLGHLECELWHVEQK